MNYIYEATCTVDLSNVLPKIAEMRDSINRSMAEFGCDHRIAIIYPLAPLRLRSVRALTDEELAELSTRSAVALSEVGLRYPVMVGQFQPMGTSVE